VTVTVTGGGFGGGGGFGPRPGAAGGTIFADVPAEMQASVELLLTQEPGVSGAEIEFTQQAPAGNSRRLTLRRMVFRHWQLGLLVALFVTIVGIAGQLGPLLVSFAIDDGIEPRRMDVVALAAGLYLLSVGVTAIAQWAMVRVSGRLAAWVMNDLRVSVFTHMQRLGLSFYTEEKAGVIMSRMTSDIENLQQLLQDGLAQFAVQALTMAVIAVILFVTNAELAAITILLIVPLLTLGSLWFQSASARGYNLVRDGIANVLADLSESLHGVRVVTAHNRQDYNVVNHRNIVGRYRRANFYTSRVNAVYSSGTQVLGYVAQAALLIIGGRMVLRGSLNIGELTAFFLYLSRFMLPIQLLVQQYNAYQQGQSSLVKLRALFAVGPSVPERSDADDLPPIQGEVVFDHVTFGYDPAVPVIHDVDLTVRVGETVAFVGPTGAGKSTMAKLVTRFYDPTAGRITIDGRDLRDITVASLRSQLGVVPQEPFLFSGTIRDNVAFARPDVPESEVWDAMNAVGLTEVVERLPHGIDTEVHERGQSLSSGERQLVALARAFIAQPRVLVLDEATSNLDLLSETKIETALDVLLQGRTAILIAHRLSTAMRADRIVVVDQGGVVELGSHQELVQLDGRYAEMYETWISGQDAERA
jgi:ATP-binding cassette, subfamily B, bacterial